MSIRQAMLSPAERIPAEQASARIMADPCAGCPPAVPAVAAGERIGEDAVRVFRYYGIRECAVVREE
jgi:arginine/lysine/ornithine decarboxylase